MPQLTGSLSTSSRVPWCKLTLSPGGLCLPPSVQAIFHTGLLSPTLDAWDSNSTNLPTSWVLCTLTACCLCCIFSPSETVFLNLPRELEPFLQDWCQMMEVLEPFWGYSFNPEPCLPWNSPAPFFEGVGSWGLNIYFVLGKLLSILWLFKILRYNLAKLTDCQGCSVRVLGW